MAKYNLKDNEAEADPKKKKGNTMVNKLITISLDPETIKILGEISKIERRSKSNMIDFLIRNFKKE